MTITLTLTPEQEAWLKAHAATDGAASIEEAARRIIDEHIGECELEHDELEWAKTLVNEGLAALERGDYISLEEHKARNAARLAALKD